MENASKAIIIAGGMLIAIAIVSLLVFAWGMFSSYQDSKDKLADIENTAKFNEQFAQYDRDDVLGYELISLINKIQDYDERQTTDTIQASNDTYKPIKIEVILDSGPSVYTNRSKLTFDFNASDASNGMRLFTRNKYVTDELTTANAGTRPDSFKHQVEDKVKQAVSTFSGKEDIAIKVAKSIGSIFMTESEVQDRANRYYSGSIEKVQQEVVRRYYSITGEVVEHTDLIRADRGTRKTNKYYEAACTYYEYMQFKKGVFRCTEIIYDTNSTGRVTSLKFEFTGTIR